MTMFFVIMRMAMIVARTILVIFTIYQNPSDFSKFSKIFLKIIPMTVVSFW